MKEEQNVSRREFLLRVSLIGAAGLGAGAVLTGCGEEEQATAELACTDVSELTEQEVQMRETLEYTDDSPFPERVCDNCQFWVAPAAEGVCGGCQILKGPVHPQGYCVSWAPRQA